MIAVRDIRESRRQNICQDNIGDIPFYEGETHLIGYLISDRKFVITPLEMLINVNACIDHQIFMCCFTIVVQSSIIVIITTITIASSSGKETLILGIRIVCLRFPCNHTVLCDGIKRNDHAWTNRQVKCRQRECCVALIQIGRYERSCRSCAYSRSTM